MNDIINHLKNLYIRVEIRRKEANKSFMNTRRQGHWGDGEKYSALEKLTYLSEDLKNILNRLASNENSIKAPEVAETIKQPLHDLLKEQSQLIGVYPL